MRRGVNVARRLIWSFPPTEALLRSARMSGRLDLSTQNGFLPRGAKHVRLLELQPVLDYRVELS